MIYICIPAHNEERTIGVLLWKIRQVMAGFPRDYQILVANDGSTDATAEVLGPYQGVLPLTVSHLDQRRGYANALELLIREAVRRAEYPKRDVVVTLQADFTDDPDELLGLLKRIEAGADIVTANTSLPVTAPRPLRWGRKVGNYLMRRRGLPEGVTDALGGLRAYRVIVMKRAIESRGTGRLLTWDGWAANAELLQLVQPHSRRTESIEYHWRGDRQQRQSRHTLWPLLGSLFRFARGGAGPLAGEPLQLPSSVEMRERHKPGGRQPAARESQPEREAGRGRRQRAGRSERETAEARPPGEKRKRPERSERPAGRVERPARGERPRIPDRARGGNGAAPPAAAEVAETPVAEPPSDQAAAPHSKRRRRRRRGGAARDTAAAQQQLALPDASETADAAGAEAGEAEAGEAEPADGVPVEAGSAAAPRKRRSRRGGRGRRARARPATDGGTQEDGGTAGPGEQAAAVPEPPPRIHELGA